MKYKMRSTCVILNLFLSPFFVFVNIRVYYVQWRSQVSWRSGRVITAVAPKININFKKIVIIY